MWNGYPMTTSTHTMPDRDDDTGRYIPDTTDDDLLAAVCDHGDAGTQAVADALDLKYNTTYKRLTDLEDEGLVERRDAPGNAYRWGVTDATAESGDRGTASASDNGDDGDGEPAAVPPADVATPDERARAALDAVRAAEDRDWSDDRLAAFTPAVVAAAQYLEHEGQATLKQFLRDVALDHPAGYSTDTMQAYLDSERDGDPGAWWQDVVRPALLQYPEVEKPQYPGGPYRWVGERP